LCEQRRPAAKKSARTPHKKSAPLTARERVLNAKPLAMYYYVGDSRGLKSVKAHGSHVGLLAPQCYWITKDGEIEGELPAGLAETTRRFHIPVMPLIFNRGFDRETVTTMLHDAAAQEHVATAMAEIASKEQLVGFQIDFENIAPEDKDLFTQFVRLVAGKLHEKDLLLSITLVPKFTEIYPAPSPPFPSTGEWAAGYDFHALGEIADFVTLMTYDHFGRQTSAGPIAGYEWVRKAVDFAVTRIPAEKLLLGIPLYGREWTEEGDQTTSRSLSNQNVRELRTRWKRKPQWDERWRSPWFKYEHRNTVHTVWYEDSRSWSAKLDLISEYHLRGFAAWRLGFEGANFWALSGIRPQAAKKTATKRSAATKSSKAAAAKDDSATRGQAGSSQ
jgi:spore germination protein